VFYERLVHRILRAGGSFDARELGTSSTSFTLQLDESKSIQTFGKIDEVKKFDNGMYAQPRASNFPAVDALVQASCMLLSGIVKSCGKKMLSHSCYPP
jgi:hypothetical protein